MNNKKLFTAELQKLKAKGATIAPVALAAASGDDGAVLAAINGLRDDLKAIELLIRGDATPTPPPPEPEIADQDVVKKRAEVNMLKTELRALAVCIQQTKAEIAALRPANSQDDRLIAVTNELDAIVTSTERATHNILEAAEKIDNLAGQLESQSTSDSFASHIAADIRDSVVAVFEACNFQDITGQRITKVVKTLQYIEERVNKMIEIWGAESFDDLPPPPEVDVDDDKKLLNGPALDNQGISQSAIDALFG